MLLCLPLFNTISDSLKKRTEMEDKFFSVARLRSGSAEGDVVHNNPERLSPQALYNESKYYILPDEDIAQKSLDEINKRLGYKAGGLTTNWCDIEVHPTSLNCLLLYTDRIEHCLDILKGYECISRNEAIKRGWYFGFHKGRYGRLIAKWEEAELLYQEIENHYGSAFYPIQKSFLLSFAYACYSIREILSLLCSYKNRTGKIKNMRSSDLQQEWWEEKWNTELDVDGQLLNYFYRIHNSDKHSTSLYITPVAKYFQFDGQCLVAVGTQFFNVDNGKYYMGSEGFFEIDHICGYPKRKPAVNFWDIMSIHNISKIEYEFEFIGVPKMHLGKEVEGNTLELIGLIKDYYASLIKEVIEKFP